VDESVEDYLMEGVSTYNEMMARLEALVRTFVVGRFECAEDLWRTQTDLLSIQVDLAGEIRELRRLREAACQEELAIVGGRKSGWQVAVRRSQAQQREFKRQLSLLTHVLDKARSFGDAFAWTLLGGNERIIAPLRENARTGWVPDEHARLGVLVIAQEMTRNGAGFPIFHDVTNILRVGDITFVGKGQDPVTVEVKTHYKGEFESNDSRSYSVQVWGKEDQVRPFVTPAAPPPASHEATEGQASLERAIAHPRLRRQLERMQIAQQLQVAKEGEILNTGDTPTLFVGWARDEHLHHWDLVRELAAQAKRAGSASATADEAIFYAAVYTDSPLHLSSNEDLDEGWLADVSAELGKSRIWYSPPHTHKNALWFSVSRSYDEDFTALHHLPFLCYPLDEEQLVDMLWGRLWFFVGVNIGKVVERLQSRGFRADYPESLSGAQRGFLRITRNVTLPNGDHGRIELQNTQLYATRMLYESLSLEGFAQLLESVARSAEQAIGNK
jgi:hypothetical protein